MARVKDISDFINSFAPYNTQCSWDNSGLLIGSAEKQVKKIGLALDLTPETLEKACESDVDLIVTHHPVIFRAQKSFLEKNIAYEAAIKGMSVISAHTCFDCAKGGVNDELCKVLGISNVVSVESEELSVPMVRMGSIKSIPSLDFAKIVSERLGTVCRVADCGNMVSNVAVCGGAGMDFYLDAVNAGADAYVTGDVSHHEMLLAKEIGVTVIAAGHFETENPSMKVLGRMIKNQFDDISVVILPQSNPVTFIG